MTAEIIASRTTGKFGVDLPKRVTTSREWSTLVSVTASVPTSRATTHAATPAIRRSRPSRHRRATSAATTMRPSAHNAPKRYRRVKNVLSSSGRPLTSVKRFSSSVDGLSWWRIARTSSVTVTISRTTSLERLRYPSSDAGPKARPRHHAPMRECSRESRGVSLAGVFVISCVTLTTPVAFRAS